MASLILVISLDIRHSPAYLIKGFVASHRLIGAIDLSPELIKAVSDLMSHVACNHPLAMWELLLTCLTQNNEQGLTTAPGLIFPFSAYFSSIDTRQPLQLHCAQSEPSLARP